MGLFSKKKLSDAERQAWSAQLLEVRAAELDEFAHETTLGSTWEEHDAEWSRLFLDYYVEFQNFAWSEMKSDGLRISGYRKFIEGEGMIVIETEFEDAPTEWAKGSVWWLVNTHEFDDDGEQIWGYQYVAGSWKEATGYMKDRVKEWDLENTRKTNQLWKDDWNRYFALVAKAILLIVTIIILAPIAAGVALGVALGETISVGLLANAVGGGLLQASAWGDKYLSWGENLFGEPVVDDSFVDALDVFEDGSATIEDVINSPGVPVFTPGGELVLLDEAPTNPAALSSGGGLGLLLAAAAALTFVI